ncbi:MAG: oxidoreductase [Bacteroidales bacterium]|nr:oxidoreductase [Bacteroidales bacterium]
MSSTAYQSDIRTNLKKRRVREIRFLTENTFVLRFDRDNIEFSAGQHVVVGTEGSLYKREYSIYSGEKQDYLEILVREVLDGNVSSQLRRVQQGDLIEVSGPFGSFIMEPRELYSRNNLFIASGTGIAPFHSFVTSYPGINYKILHGIRKWEDAYEKNEYDPQRYLPCVSQDPGNSFNGRVTDFLPDYPDEPDLDYYICGNSNMILDVNKILKNKGVTSGRIFIEVYF